MSYTLYLLMYFHKYNTSQTQNSSTVKHCTRRRAAWDPCPLHPPKLPKIIYPHKTINNTDDQKETENRKRDRGSIPSNRIQRKKATFFSKK